MSQFTEISPITALPNWNKFTSSQPIPPPFSFNPSLFSFYQNHFHWKPYYFLLYEGHSVVGILPLVNTGKAWVSLPHFSYGGVLWDNGGARMNPQKLVSGLFNLVRESEAASGFFRCQLEDIHDSYGRKEKIYVRSLLPVDSTPDGKAISLIQLPVKSEELFERLSSNLRRKIRKASRNLAVKAGKEELLNDFYPVYTKNMHRLGSPAYGKHFFSDLMNTYEFGEALFFVIYKEKKPVAASMLMSYNGFWENTWFSTKKETQKEYVSDFLHWQMIQYAIRRHASIYSFGRSDKDGSVFCYKNHWPVENLPIYEYSLNRRSNIKSHKRLAKLWRKIPYPVAYYLGPGLVRHIY